MLNFERVKWGGARRGQLLYCMFDLEQFPADWDCSPSPEDIRYLNAILRTSETSAPGDGPTQLRERLRAAFPANRAEAAGMAELLCERGALVPSGPRPVRGGKNDWARAEDWRGEDGYDRERVEALFAHISRCGPPLAEGTHYDFACIMQFVSTGLVGLAVAHSAERRAPRDGGQGPPSRGLLTGQSSVSRSAFSTVPSAAISYSYWVSPARNSTS